jgi:hypothetical protein
MLSTSSRPVARDHRTAASSVSNCASKAAVFCWFKSFQVFNRFAEHVLSGAKDPNLCAEFKTFQRMPLSDQLLLGRFEPARYCLWHAANYKRGPRGVFVVRSSRRAAVT